MTTVDLLVWPPGDVRWDLGARHSLPRSVAGAIQQIDTVLDATPGPDWVLFWDPVLGPPPEAAVVALTAGNVDAVHAGLLLGMAGLPEDVDYIHPTWWFGVDPPPAQRALSWRLSVRAAVIRTAVMRSLGHLDPAMETLEGAALDMGWRYLARGAVIVHDPALLHDADPLAPAEIPLTDRYLFLIRHYPDKWARYARWRRPFIGGRAFASARRRAAAATPPPSGPYARSLRPLPVADQRRVSVILPTLGRYALLADLLEDIAEQTIKPYEVLCIDQNSPDERDPSVYQRFAGRLPLEVIYQDERGQWLARNAAVSRSSGELLLFMDDDSRIGSDFIARHLQGLDSYDAGISAGASLSVVGAPVPASYGHFRAADQFDSGNALVRREVMVQVGAFDRRYDRMRGGDADFGTRVYLAGGISIHNPLASRQHLKAASGGLRSFGSWDAYRQAGWLTPRPLPSVVYYLWRYYSPRQARESLVIGLAQSVIPYALKRTATRWQWARYVAQETLLLPLLAVRVGRSLRKARHMLAAGPLIPAVTVSAPPAQHPLASAHPASSTTAGSGGPVQAVSP